MNASMSSSSLNRSSGYHTCGEEALQLHALCRFIKDLQIFVVEFQENSNSLLRCCHCLKRFSLLAANDSGLSAGRGKGAAHACSSSEGCVNWNQSRSHAKRSPQRTGLVSSLLVVRLGSTGCDCCPSRGYSRIPIGLSASGTVLRPPAASLSRDRDRDTPPMLWRKES